MTYPVRGLIYAAVLFAAAWVLSPEALARSESWPDVSGGSFRGEPTELLGPFVIFRTAGDGGRRVRMRAFSPEDCRRIHARLAARAPQAETLAAARGEATAQLIGRVLRVTNRDLQPADLAAEPEPALLLVLGGSHNDGAGWFMAGNLTPFYQRVQRIYPDLMEGVFVGARHDAGQHHDMAVSSGMPWLVADYRAQSAMPAISRYAPRNEGANAVLLTREGVPLVVSAAGEVAAVCRFVDETARLLGEIDPANPRGWADRVHYLNATRPVAFAQSRADPLLVGDPLRADGLRQYGVKRVAARLAVATDGKVTPTILSAAADLPAALRPALTAALAQSVVVPAVDHGRLVGGTVDYLLEVPPADAGREADAVWLGSTDYPLQPIPEWLVLRPIKVEEQDFGMAIVGHQADGTVILNAMEVNSGRISRAAQMSAFNHDWFGAAGAGEVRPAAGDRQALDDGTVLTWEKVRSMDGLVDMQSGLAKDYTVGYAWAEFTVPAATDAWLGLGSDDGVRLWLNGELVHDRWIRRPSRVDEDVVPLHLQAGANRLLVKIQNATGDWSFLHRLRLKP